MNVVNVILAAGQGTRMRSSLPKVLHRLSGKALIDYALETAGQTSGQLPVVVIGHGSDQVRAHIGSRAVCVLQEPQLGTGHALQQARQALADFEGLVVVTYADMPLLQADTIKQMIAGQSASRGMLTILTVTAQESRGFGRVVRDRSGQVAAIVEEAQATPEQLQIRELNVGVYIFQAGWLWQALDRLQVSPKGEYYLTDCVDLSIREGHAVNSVQLSDPAEGLGINNRIHLAEAETHLRQRINRQHMLAGVTITDPASTYIEAGVRLGQDTVIHPNTHLCGQTIIGTGCVIGPDCLIRDTTIGDDCRITTSVLEGALLEDKVSMGPYCHLRKGARLCRGVHMGNFGEVKESTLKPGVKMGHFSYIGNATIGEETNIGAGTITCNFDGSAKNHTEIGENVFIGSDTMLVAPVRIGDRARTGAGSVVTHDVPEDTLVAGVPARAMRKLTREAENEKTDQG